MTTHISRQLCRISLCALVSVAACSDTVAPPPPPPSLVIEGTVTDSAGVFVPGSEVRLWLNYVLNWEYFAETFADSLGRYRLRYDSLPGSLDSITGTARGPGCHVANEALSVSPPTGPLTSETVLPTPITLTKALPRATGDTGRFYGRASDDGLFGYAGCLYMLTEESVASQSTGDIVLRGKWDIVWNPSYGDDVGTFQGVQTDSVVDLVFDEGGCLTQWEAPVNASGAWGILTPNSAPCTGSWWGMFPVALARDTSSGAWP